MTTRKKKDTRVRRALASRLKQFRSNRRESMRTFAQRAGIGLSHLHQLEHGLVTITVHDVVKIAPALRTAPVTLFRSIAA